MPAQVEQPIPMRALLAGARRKEEALIELAKKLVCAESPSDNKAAVDGCAALAADHAGALGGRVKVHRQKEFGNILEARFGPRSAADRILLLGHLDTVWPVGPLPSCPGAFATGGFSGRACST